MMYANELAPQLFTSYTAWYKNYMNTCNVSPSKEEMEDAALYFLNRDIPGNKKKICPLIHNPCMGERCICFDWTEMPNGNNPTLLLGHCKQFGKYTGDEKEEGDSNDTDG